MQRAWTPPLRWVFVVATFLGVFSTLQAYRLMTLDMQKPMEPELFRLLILNLAYWYVPAALTAVIFRVSHRFRLDTPHWRRALLAQTRPLSPSRCCTSPCCSRCDWRSGPGSRRTRPSTGSVQSADLPDQHGLDVDDVLGDRRFEPRARQPSRVAGRGRSTRRSSRRGWPMPGCGRSRRNCTRTSCSTRCTPSRRWCTPSRISPTG